MQDDLLRFLDENLRHGGGRVCSSRLVIEPAAVDRIRRRCAELNAVAVDLALNRIDGACAQKSCLLFDALIYKFGRSNRHQKFWRNALQLYAELKRVNRQNVTQYMKKFVETLEKCGHVYEPSKSAVRHLGALLLERVVRFDRLRVHCFRTADAAMGYVEMRHHLTFNLMLIAIASDIAREAADHIQHLRRAYDALADWFRGHSERFPPSADKLQLASMRPEYSDPLRAQKLEEVRSIIRLLNMSELEEGLEAGDDLELRLRNVNDVIMKALKRTDPFRRKRTTCRLIDRRPERAT